MINPKKTINKIRLLDQGTYGCIFYPGVNCSGKMERKQYITKVQKEKDTSENELKIGKYIQKIKLYGMYFAPILKSCPIQLAKIEREEITKCELFDSEDQAQLKEKMKYISNKIRYVGKNTLQTHLIERLQSDIYTFFPHFLETHIYLLNSIVKLTKINVIHYDIKENNIIYDPMNRVPIIIDFGLSFNIKELTNKANMERAFYTYYDKYSPWCLEIIMISYMIKENRDNWDTRPIPIEKLNSVIDSFFLNNPVMILISKIVDIHPFIKKWKMYVRKYIHKKGKDFINELLKHANTWDHYGISVMYLFMLHDFHWIIPNTDRKEETSFLFQYQSLLVDHILSIPINRISFTKIIENIHHIGENINTNEYVQWIKKTIQSSELLYSNQNSRFLETKEIEKRIENIVYGGREDDRKSAIVPNESYLG